MINFKKLEEHHPFKECGSQAMTGKCFLRGRVPSADVTSHNLEVTQYNDDDGDTNSDTNTKCKVSQ